MLANLQLSVKGKNKIMKTKNTIIVFIYMAGLVTAQYEDTNIPDVVTKVATAAGNWLKLETSARAIGMGGAHVAVDAGIAGTPYNPASAAFVEGSEAYFSKVNYVAGISHLSMGYGTQLSSTDYLGLHLFFLDSGPMDVTNEWYPDGTGENFHVYGLSFRTTYAKTLTDRLRFGITLKYVREQIYTTYMQSFSVDIGSNFKTGIFGFDLGMCVSNYGPDVQFHGEGLEIPVGHNVSVDSAAVKITEKFPLPLAFRLGVRNDIIGPGSVFVPSSVHRLTLVADGVAPIDYTLYGSFGLEYSWMEFVQLRMGYRFGRATGMDDSDRKSYPLAGLSMGGGLYYKVRGFSLGVDYAIVDDGILDMTHQFGINLGF